MTVILQQRQGEDGSQESTLSVFTERLRQKLKLRHGSAGVVRAVGVVVEVMHCFRKHELDII
jgi:hypothetical protein